MKYLLHNQDGEVAVLCTGDAWRSIELEFPRLVDRQGRPYVSWEELPEDKIPNDRTFRNAWVGCSANKIKVDLPKAKEIHKNKLRELRKPKLEKLDVDMMLAIENDDVEKKDLIKAKKQELRDVTKDPELDRIQTPEELKAFIPNCLKD